MIKLITKQKIRQKCAVSFPQLFTYNENKSKFVFESLSLQIGYNELVSNMFWKFVLSDTFVHRYSIYKIAVLTFRGNYLRQRASQ